MCHFTFELVKLENGYTEGVTTFNASTYRVVLIAPIAVDDFGFLDYGFLGVLIFGLWIFRGFDFWGCGFMELLDCGFLTLWIFDSPLFGMKTDGSKNVRNGRNI